MKKILLLLFTIATATVTDIDGSVFVNTGNLVFK